MRKRQENISVNEYININDVKGKLLYTKDDFIFSFLSVQPISIALMSRQEKTMLTDRMTRELSPFKISFKLLFLSREADVSHLIDYYESIKSTTADAKKRENLTKMMRFFSDQSNSGGVLERQTYFLTWTHANDNIDDFANTMLRIQKAFADCRCTARVCEEKEILAMLNLFYNPKFRKAESDITVTPIFAPLLTEENSSENL